MDHVISESYYKGTILQSNNRKMTISWSFSYDSFVKFNGKKKWAPQHDHVSSVLYQNLYYNEVCNLGTAHCTVHNLPKRSALLLLLIAGR